MRRGAEVQPHQLQPERAALLMLKNRESRDYRWARREGFLLRKHRGGRGPYPTYNLLDVETNGLVLGGGRWWEGVDLDQIEDFLTSQPV